MWRKRIAFVVAIAMAFGGSKAQTAVALAPTAPQSSVALRNEPALKPGSPAGIREAQGIADLDVWFISGLILASIVAALLLTEEDDSTDATGATN
jgi:hypothetical protein